METHVALAFIFLLYTTIGLLAAGGSIALTARLSPRLEQAVYGLLLTPIAAIYLAFLTYIRPTASWPTELLWAVLFALLGLVGTRLTPFLILGYAGHGVWDLIHEVLTLQDQAGSLTHIPLAYGVFCAVFDWAVAAYFWTRRKAWGEARRVAG